MREGYANFDVADPPLKLILFENGRGGDLNHLGVEVETTAEVAAETERLAGLGHELEVEDAVVCCHAEQDKAWARDPSGLRWEVYAITDDDPPPMETTHHTGGGVGDVVRYRRGCLLRGRSDRNLLGGAEADPPPLGPR